MAELKDRKVILSTLWIFAILNYIYADVFGLSFNPILQPEVTITITQGSALAFAVLMETAIAMVLLSRVLKYRANRWANIALITDSTDLLLPGVPATLVGGVLLWRRAALGYVVAAGLLFAFGLTPIALAAILALQPWLTGSAIDCGTIVGLLVFAAIAYVPLGFFVRGTRADTRPAARALEVGATSA